ncbi:unnamed protein product, partial [Vitis vinifera]|uniref:Uncharacterized protein n=1 Tax=Vitis vinifera TaxID=29760 RepID=D7SWW8_VITVI
MFLFLHRLASAPIKPNLTFTFCLNDSLLKGDSSEGNARDDNDTHLLLYPQLELKTQHHRPMK